MITSYDVPEKMRIDYLSIQVNHVMRTDTVPANNYYLKVNQYGGVNGFPASGWYRYDETTYVLYWDLTAENVNIDGTTVLMFKGEYSYLSAFSGIPHWMWWLRTTDIDNFNDGSRSFMVLDHTSEGIWINFNMPGAYRNIPDNYYDDSIGYVYRDLIIQMCVSRQAGWDVHDYTNLVNVDYLSTDTLQKNETIGINYFLNETALAHTNILYIDREGHDVVKTYNLPAQDGVIYHTPKDEGTFYANFSVNGVNISSDTFVVSGGLTQYVYTEVNPTAPGEGFYINYKYTGTVWQGVIALSHNNEVVWSKDIQPNTEGRVYCNAELEGGAYELSLNALYRNVSLSEQASSIHAVSPDYTAFIAHDSNPAWTALYPGTGMVATHNHIGQDVWIVVGSSRVEYIGDIPYLRVAYHSPHPDITKSAL